MHQRSTRRRGQNTTEVERNIQWYELRQGWILILFTDGSSYTGFVGEGLGIDSEKVGDALVAAEKRWLLTIRRYRRGVSGAPFPYLR